MANEPERRALEFNSLDEVVAEAEKLASGEVRTTGSHTFGQILEHLARTHDMTTGRLEGPKPPWYMRLMIPLMKPFLLADKPLKPGFKLPPKAEAFFWPDQEFDVQEALSHLKESIEHYKKQGPLPKHPHVRQTIARTKRQHELSPCGAAFGLRASGVGATAAYSLVMNSQLCTINWCW